MKPAPRLDVSATINAPAERVMAAFFDPVALEAWWQVARSVATPRVLGPYTMEWDPTGTRDEVLGRLGGVFRGTIVELRLGQAFLIADAYWLPPDGEAIGPMALEVTLRAEATDVTHVHVRQTGFEESARWRRYYEVINRGWTRALARLKTLLEK